MKILSLIKTKHTGTIYSSRSLHFWCLFYATATPNPSKPAKRTDKKIGIFQNFDKNHLKCTVRSSSFNKLTPPPCSAEFEIRRSRIFGIPWVLKGVGGEGRKRAEGAPRKKCDQNRRAAAILVKENPNIKANISKNFAPAAQNHLLSPYRANLASCYLTVLHHNR